ncbi:MAG: right-handed parallel beta-helix repeat-containing protein [Candidatus Thermoplasmatota archaeon]|nr:right-handed parallel beta-helix repeat-containing protein [Candidatus Thermoplasmatota archaeon]
MINSTVVLSDNAILLDLTHYRHNLIEGSMDPSKTRISSNNILYVGGYNSNNYSTIQKAIKDAQKGDTIFVYEYSSPYNENIVIDKSVVLIGENTETTIIDGQYQSSTVIVSADNITIKNFTIQNSAHNQNDAGLIINSDGNLVQNVILINNEHGVRFEYSRNSIFLENKIENNNQNSIFISESSNLYIYENTIKNSNTGIDINKGATYNEIYANSIQNMEKGIFLFSSSHNSIYWNIISNSVYAIYLDEANENEIYNENVISDNMNGIFLVNSFSNKIYDENLIKDNEFGVIIESSFNNDVNENIIRNNDYGVLLNKSFQNDIYWNQITENHKGIYIQYSYQNEIYLNNIINNYQTGLFIELSTFTKIFYNNFIENYISASFIIDFLSFNMWKKNYWDDWSGNGVYRIPGNIIDFDTDVWYNYDFKPKDSLYDL